MKRIAGTGLLTAAALALMVALPAQAGSHGGGKAMKAGADAEVQQLATEAKQIVKGFFTELKGTLVGAMKKDGPAGAVDVCAKKAHEITLRHNRDGWEVGRTALKLRNPNNAPDAWEKAVLEEFEQKIAAGADPKKLAKAEIVEQDGRKVFRFMKAIPTGKPCLTCHGDKVDPALLQKIRSYYPDDQATGFTLGQLRGAFTLSKPLN